MTYFVYGGSASGKSQFAENIVAKCSHPRTYIATMKPWDDECHQRIEKHRLQRADKGFSTIECYDDLDHISIENNQTVLLECMGNLVANVLFSAERNGDLYENICKNLAKLSNSVKNLIVVSNDVFLENPPQNTEMQDYLQLLSRLNCFMAKTFDVAVDVVCGIPIYLKGGDKVV